MAQLVKTVAGLAIASCKTVNGLAIASVKTINGLDNTGSAGYSVLGTYAIGSTDGNTFTAAASDTSGADLIVVGVTSYTGATAPVLTDSKSNTWTARTAYDSTGLGGIERVRLYYCRGGTVGSGHTFTLTQAGAFATVQVLWASGSNATPYDTENGSSGTSAALQTGSITPSVSGCLLVSIFSHNDAGNTSSIGSGFTTARDITAAGGAHISGSLGYLIHTSGAINPTWTESGTPASANASAIAAFKP